MRHISSEKRQTTPDGRSQIDKSRKNRTLGEKETYKYSGIFEADTIKQVEMKEDIKKAYIRKTRKLLETKLFSRNLVKWINSWAVPPRKIFGTILEVDWRTQTNEPENKKINDHAKGIASQRWRWQIYVSRKRKRSGQRWRLRWRFDPTTRRLHRKARIKTDYSHQKQYRRHMDQQNGNNQKKEWGEK